MNNITPWEKHETSYANMPDSRFISPKLPLPNTNIRKPTTQHADKRRNYTQGGVPASGNTVYSDLKQPISTDQTAFKYEFSKQKNNYSQDKEKESLTKESLKKDPTFASLENTCHTPVTIKE